MRGLTLVEVVAGLALLGSLLVGLLLAKISLARQRVEAEKRLEAVDLCDRLLANWQASGKKVPLQASGQIGQAGRFRWSTRVVRTQAFETTVCDVVRLEVAEPTNHGMKSLAHVEVLTN